MTKRVRAKYKPSRQYGVNLWGRAKDPFETKNYVPGQHGPSGKRKVISDYGKQLAAKQKLRKYYSNITEKQFVRVFKEAVRRKGDTGENLIGLLEQRLDAVIYRANFVPSMYAARQLVSHKHVLINGRKVNVPSHPVKIGDVVQISEKASQIPMVLEAAQNIEREIPTYIESDTKKLTAKINNLPNLADVPFPFQVDLNLIIEFYSR